MSADILICPNLNCADRSVSGVVVHDKRRGRLRCTACGKTWSKHRGRPEFRLRVNPIKFRRALEMLRAGLPIRKIARLIDVSAGTVMRWKKKFINK